jgi:hypothetical protein
MAERGQEAGYRFLSAQQEAKKISDNKVTYHEVDFLLPTEV